MKPGVLEPRPTQRRWHDMKKHRLFLGLAAAPIPSVALGLLLIVLFDTSLLPEAAGAILAAAVGWALVTGWLYLFLVARSRGVLGRVECLLLGVIAASTLPLVADFLSNAVDWLTAGNNAPSTADDLVDPLADGGPSGFAIAIILAIMLAPFGLLGGWIFWRVGVRPTLTTVGDVAPVFD